MSSVSSSSSSLVQRSIPTYQQDIAKCEKLYTEHFDKLNNVAKLIAEKRKEWKTQFIAWNTESTAVTAQMTDYAKAQVEFFNKFKETCDQISQLQNSGNFDIFTTAINDLKEALAANTPENQKIFERMGRSDIANDFKNLNAAKEKLEGQIDNINELFNKILADTPKANVHLEKLAKFAQVKYGEYWFVSKTKEFFRYTPFIGLLMSPSSSNSNNNNNSITSSWNKDEKKV
jgi:chromosome segregation ATPase